MTAPISASLMPAAEISWREDLMSMPHCDTRSYPRQYAPAFARPPAPSLRFMRHLLWLDPAWVGGQEKCRAKNALAY